MDHAMHEGMMKSKHAKGMKKEMMIDPGPMPGDYVKYPAEGAPVTKYGGNAAIHDGVRTTEDPLKASKDNDIKPGK